MSQFRRVTDDFWVSPQISVADVVEAKAQGFLAIINNRPDGEAQGQPTGAEIEAEARSHGLVYLHAPVSAWPTAETVAAVDEAVRGAKTLAFCRSGTRSIITWALGQVGRRSAEELVQLGDAAGYDLRPAISK